MSRLPLESQISTYSIEWQTVENICCLPSTLVTYDGSLALVNTGRRRCKFTIVENVLLMSYVGLVFFSGVPYNTDRSGS